MQKRYDSSDYFLVGNVNNGTIYVIYNIYKLLFEVNQPLDTFPCYPCRIHRGQGVVYDDRKEFISRHLLDYAEELVS